MGPGISKEIETKFKQLTDTHFSSSPCLFVAVNRISVVKTDEKSASAGAEPHMVYEIKRN